MKSSKYLLVSFLAGGFSIADNTTLQTALFAGGCFWCMEDAFEGHKGIKEVQSGYAGGTQAHPTYKNYAQSGHVEVVKVIYNPKIISYDQLLDIFWRTIDPTDAGGQFGDRGAQYRSIIFYTNEVEEKKARESKRKLEHSHRFSKPIVTDIAYAPTFYKAEEYHQNYAVKNPVRYAVYKYFSGRTKFFKKYWNKHNPIKKVYDPTAFQKPTDSQLRKQLTSLQYQVTQHDKTEPPFTDKQLHTNKPGIYIDVVSGEPLFSSLDKYDSNTGWPSFTKPLEPTNLIEKEDIGWLGTRTEIRSKLADSHLGHLFTDGPTPTGLRYCINSAALEFVPLDQLDPRGYNKYISLFT